MRDTSCEASHRFELLRMAQFNLHALAFRDVVEANDGTFDRPGLEYREAGVIHCEASPVGPPEILVIATAALPGRQHPINWAVCHRIGGGIWPSMVEQLVVALAADIGGETPEHPGSRPIH